MNATQGYVLIVEDDPDVQGLLRTTLVFHGYRVLTASNGYDGLEAIQKERPQLVIADIMMPRMDGFGLVNRLRLNPETREIPVVVITATYVAPEDREFAQSIGATRFIQKPIDLEQFIQTIRQLVEQGTHVGLGPLMDREFYDGYRQRLEAKFQQKSDQIAQYQRLLSDAPSGEERATLESSLGRAIRDLDEVKILLEQIRGHLNDA